MRFRTKTRLTFAIPMAILLPIGGYLALIVPNNPVLPSPFANATNVGQSSNRVWDTKTVPLYPIMIGLSSPFGFLAGWTVVTWSYVNGFPMGFDPETKRKWDADKKPDDEWKQTREWFKK